MSVCQEEDSGRCLRPPVIRPRSTKGTPNYELVLVLEGFFVKFVPAGGVLCREEVKKYRGWKEHFRNNNINRVKKEQSQRFRSTKATLKIRLATRG